MADKTLEFIKMDGLGNDFVIIDVRKASLLLSEDQVKSIANRKNAYTGGCDQLILMGPSEHADISMSIYNADGSSVGACGNASRCVAFLLANELGSKNLTIETPERVLSATVEDEGNIKVNMGQPRFDWQDIPLSQSMDTLHLKLQEGSLSDPVGVSMGNPHAVFFVDDVNRVDLASIGPKLEQNKLFPERANIGAAQIVDRKNIKLRVWERGVGETQACGTGACAALVAAVRRNLTEHSATVHVKGGKLQITWDKDSNHVIMGGAVSKPQRGAVKI